MKKYLLAGAALVLTGATAFALDDDRDMRTRVHVSSNATATLAGEQGVIVEVRGADGDRTIHIDGDGRNSVLEIDGQRVEIEGNTVRVDGETVDVAGDGIVVIDGTDIRVVTGQSGRHHREIELHMAEQAADLADMERHLSSMVIDLDVEGLQGTVQHSLELALAGLDEGRIESSDDWDELSEEEKAEVREEIRQARDELREAMREMRVEFRAAGADMAREQRVARVEIERAHREIARAERDLARANVELRRAEVIRHHVGVDRISGEVERVNRVLRETGAGDVRIEETDGRRRVWIDDEEQTGDDLVDWLNRLEIDRLSGQPGETLGRHRVEHADGSRRIIELDGGGQVVIMEYRSSNEDE